MAQPCGGNECVLVVEDDSPIRTMMTLTLEGYGYRVLAARDAVEAQHVWRDRERAVNLLITDMIMPGKMNGLRLAEELRRTRPDLPVIISSGYTTEVCDGAKLRAAGIEYLAKPFTSDCLATLVRESLDRAASSISRS